MVEKPPKDEGAEVSDLVHKIIGAEGLSLAKSSMLEALRYGTVQWASRTKGQYFPHTDITTWDEYPAAVMDGLNRVGEKVDESVIYDSDRTIGSMWEFYNAFGRDAVDLNESLIYKRVLAGNILGALRHTEGADEAIKAAKLIYETYGEEIELESLIEAHKLMTPTQIALLKPQPDEE